jgi:O-succinylbenzoic acid--CoA ligase
MDPHSLVSPSFWQSEESLHLSPQCLTPVPDLPCPSLVFATSGSTGKPRQIVLSKTSLLLSAKVVNAHLQVDASSVWGLCLPWWHVGGMGVVARAYQAGAILSIDRERWQPDACMRWLRENAVTHLSLVPTQVHDLVAAGHRAPSSLRAVVVGGGRLERDLGRRARELGWPVLASYGMTEAGSQIATQDLLALQQPYVSEPLPLLPCWDVRATGQGILEISGPVLFHGEMIGEPGAWHYEPRAGEWYQTQDCGEVMDGHLRLRHRADALVKVLGELVDPTAIESALTDAGLPAGRFAVIVVPDTRKEHRLVLAHEHLDATVLASALDAYHQHCPGYARIESQQAIASLPRSDLGKILRRELLSVMEKSLRA